MNDRLQRFVTTFRELEKKEYTLSTEQEASWRQLKEKLSQATVTQDTFQSHGGMQTIVVAGLYPRAGASFLASNYAYFLALQGMVTTLCEFPAMLTYLYFSLDFDTRVTNRDDQENTLYLLNQNLRIRVNHPLAPLAKTQEEIVKWFLSNHKHSQVLIIDISSSWRHHLADWLMQMADQIWLVIDTDIPRLAQTICTDQPPAFWKRDMAKVRIIQNKWCGDKRLSKISKMVEATISLWDQLAKGPVVSGYVSRMESGRVLQAQRDGQLLLERFHDQQVLVEELASLDKGRFL